MGVLDRDTPPYRIDAGREDLGIPHNMGARRCAVEAFVSEASLSRQQCVIRKTHLSQPVQSTNSRKISDIVFHGNESPRHVPTFAEKGKT